MTTEHDSDPRTAAQAAPTPRGQEARVTSPAQGRLESASIFSGPPPPQGRATAAVSDLVAVVSGFASATMMTYLFTRSCTRAFVIGAVMAVCSLVPVITARGRRASS